MRDQLMRKTVTLLILLATLTVSIAAYPLQSYDHDKNPAYLAVQYGKLDRKYIESGFSVNVGAGNSYFHLNEIFVENLVIDTNKIFEDLNGASLDINAALSFEFHSIVSAAAISGGGYTNMDAVVSVDIPNSLFDILANGIDLTDPAKSYSGDESVYGRAFIKTGVYGGYRMKDWQFSAKLGAFLPLAYVDKSSSYSYSLSADAAASFDAGFAGNIAGYMPIDVNDIVFDPYNLSSYTDILGYNMDFGVIKYKNEKPHYGVSLTGITLAPAHLDYKTTATISGSVSMDGLLNFDAAETEYNEFEYTTSQGDFTVSLPIRLGGFYRYELIGLVDLLGSAGLTYDNSILVDFDVTATGNFFPLNMVHASIGYDQVLWESEFGVCLNARILEIGADVALASPRLARLFSITGVSARIYTAIGF